MTRAALQEKADSLLRQEAYSNLSERLKEGKQVGRCHLIDLLDNEFNSADRYSIALQEVEQILMRGGLGATEYADKLIEKYLNAPDNQYLVEEEMGEIEHAEPDYYQDAVETGMA